MNIYSHVNNFASSPSLPHPNMEKIPVFARSAPKTFVMQNPENEYARYCRLLAQYLFFLSLVTGLIFFFSRLQGDQLYIPSNSCVTISNQGHDSGNLQDGASRKVLLSLYKETIQQALVLHIWPFAVFWPAT